MDVHQPDFRLEIEIGHREAFLYTGRYAGPGLPVGVTCGAATAIGGIDSPVAGWMAMKRGLSIEGLHFHSFLFTGRRSQEKARDLCQKLATYSGKMTLHMINVAAIQQHIKESSRTDGDNYSSSRMMVRLAEAVAANRLQAIVTGESLGQGSQPNPGKPGGNQCRYQYLNIKAFTLAMDKHEIVSLAEGIGSYNISIQPLKIAVPSSSPPPFNPPRLRLLKRRRTALDIPRLIKDAISGLESVSTKFVRPTGKPFTIK